MLGPNGRKSLAGEDLLAMRSHGEKSGDAYAAKAESGKPKAVIERPAPSASGAMRR